MTGELTTGELPKCEKTGLTLLLSRSLGSQELAQHRAMVAVELEVLAYKFDRFGWKRDRGTVAQNRVILDWMNALQDYPLQEIREACRLSVLEEPARMPNEGHILAIIRRERGKVTLRISKPEPERHRVTAEQAKAILLGAGISVKGMGE